MMKNKIVAGVIIMGLLLSLVIAQQGIAEVKKLTIDHAGLR
ncbi:MAG: hypothetical protein QMD07_08285 [Thermodesulfovibrionales bacterium]|nr:hypothetical protein [Thermodesulfovibrionales bacterium]